jgi:hypothetical protein
MGSVGSSGSIPAPQAYLRLAELCTIVQYVVIMHAMLKSGELFNRAVSATA